MKKIKIAASGIFFTGIFPFDIFPEINLISAGKALMGTFIAWFAVLTYSMFRCYILPDYTNIPIQFKIWMELQYLL